jgi:hypothetical protein
MDYKTLREGEDVTFNIVLGDRGRPQADKSHPAARGQMTLPLQEGR